MVHYIRSELLIRERSHYKGGAFDLHGSIRKPSVSSLAHEIHWLSELWIPEIWVVALMFSPRWNTFFSSVSMQEQQSWADKNSMFQLKYRPLEHILYST